MTYLLNSLFAGGFWLMAGLFGLTRHFLLEPMLVGYPRSPQWLQHVFFIFSAVLIYAGLTYITVWFTGEAEVSPPGATALIVIVAFVTFVYKGSLLANTLTKWRPA